MRELGRDLRYSVRALSRLPGFTAVAVVTLALGIGANAAIFNLVDTVMRRPLAVADLPRLQSVLTVSSDFPGFFPVSYRNYVDLRDHNTVFSRLAAVTPVAVGLTEGGEPEQIDGAMVSGNYFDTLGVRPALGRTFVPDEDSVPGAHPVVVLSHALWQRRFGADPRLVGRVIQLNHQAFTVIGVAQPGFNGTSLLAPAGFWVPLMMHDQVLPQALRPLFDMRKATLLGVLGRLRPGLDPQRAEVAMKTLAAGLARDYPDDNKGLSLALLPLAHAATGANDRRILARVAWLLAAVVAVILLIACTHVANMLVVRGAGRRKEIAVRLALGVGRGRLIRQLLTETLLLFLLAGVADLLVASWTNGLIARLVAPRLPGVSLGLDWRLLLFIFGLSLVTGLAFGLAPALQSSRPDLVPALKNEAAAGHRRWLSLRNGFLAGQVGLSLVAVIGAFLFLASFRNAQRLDPGFERQHLLVASFNLDSQGFGEPRAEAFLDQLVQRVESLAGVRSAAVAENLMLVDFGMRRRLKIEGRELAASDALLAQTSAVGPHYFETLRIPILRGRGFVAQDRADSRGVAVINRTFADRYWPGADPVGAHLRLPKRDLEIVGVAQDVKYNFLVEDPQLYLYLPIAQSYSSQVTLHVRTAGDPAPLADTVRRTVQAAAPTLPLQRLATISEVIDGRLWTRRAGATLMAVLAALVLVLAGLGVYGVISYSIVQRRSEIGIRVSLGATPAAVVRLFVAHGMAPVAAGLGLGLLAALATTRFIAAMLVGIGTGSPLAFGAAILVMTAIAAAANYLPARRAAAASPARIMRQE
ncbi:MAG TPA: ABC transporter permease [Thermoanaerobaculia bacterium]|jgi:predicted permease|nr:ABC transporter permease [Thermoanaerobaculia bacterium]